MKSFLSGLLIVAAVVCISADKEAFMKLKDDCKTEVGLTEDLSPNNKPNYDDPKVKCFFTCMAKKMERMAGGKIIMDKVFELAEKRHPNLDEDKKNKLKECVTTANEQTEECDVGGSFVKCYIELFPHPPNHPGNHGDNM